MARLLLAQDSLLPPNFKTEAPPLLRVMRRVLTMGAPRFDSDERGTALSSRIAQLGPTYIKLGQFLATRPDIIGDKMAADLRHLQDKMPPFDTSLARAMLVQEIPAADKLICNLSEPIAAASIAQVHMAQDAREPTRKLAVKFLRPNIEATLRDELRVFQTLARWTERLSSKSRRLRPVESLKTLARTMAFETDLRLEAAALSEMYENSKDDRYFTVPEVYWEATSKRILSMQWIDGTPASDLAALRQAGHNMAQLAERLIQTFLRHALRDGFFHADMHQGNLLIAADGTLVGIDLGINGRLSADSRRFLAEILHGFIIRDYELVARIHFEAGYVPQGNNMAEFAQALRSIGEPIRDQNAGDISMAHLLNQLFEITEQFQMQTQPQLLLLQKTMVTVEGVARSFDPDLNFWDAASPVISDWLKKQLGPEAQLRSMRDSVIGAGRALQRLPQTLTALETASQKLLQDEPSTDRMARWLAIIAIAAAATAIVLFWLAL